MPRQDQAAVLALEEQFRLAKVERTSRRSIACSMTPLFNESERHQAEQGRTARSVAHVPGRSADAGFRRRPDAGDLATVTGRQTEINGTGSDPMLFTRDLAEGQRNVEVVLGHAVLGPQSQQTARPQPRIRRDRCSPRVPSSIRMTPLSAGRTVGFVNDRSWSLDIPGESPIPVTAVAADGQDAVHFIPDGRLSDQSSAQRCDSTGNVAAGDQVGPQGRRPIAFGSGTLPLNRRRRLGLGEGWRRRSAGRRSIKRVDPIYPQEAKDAGVSGVVIVEMLIDEAGNVTDAKSSGACRCWTPRRSTPCASGSTRRRC